MLNLAMTLSVKKPTEHNVIQASLYKIQSKKRLQVPGNEKII